MANFADIANKKAAEVEKPPLCPIGDYVMMVVNDPQPVAKSSDKGNFEIVDFEFQGVIALDTVDQDEMKAFGKPAGVRVRHSFVFNTDPDEEANFDRTLYNMTRFLVDVLKVGDDSMSVSQLLGNAKGAKAQVDVGHRPDNRPGKENEIYPDCKKVLPLD